MRILLPFLSLLLLCSSTDAQTFQWAKRMGSPKVPGTYRGMNQSTDEAAIDMAIDPNANVYVLSVVGGNPADVDGHSLSLVSSTDVVLSSYSCEGLYRWSKVVGSSLDSDMAFSVRTDGKDGVYICGQSANASSSSGLHVDTDTVIANSIRNMYLIKWDTSGKYQWFRAPQATNTSYYNANTLSLLLDMDIVPDEQGSSTVYLLAYLTPGYYGGTFAAMTEGTYILKYDESGKFLGGLNLPISISKPNPLALNRTRLTCNGGNYFISGSATSSFLPFTGSTTISGTVLPNGGGYVCKFDNTGKLVFLKIGSTKIGPIERVQTDKNNDIYIAGRSDDSGIFNGVIFRNSSAQTPYEGASAFAMKMDGTTGNVIWSQNAQSGGSDAGRLSISRDKVFMCGNFNGLVRFSTDSISNTYAVDGSDCYIVQMDAGTGVVQRHGTFGSTGFEVINLSVADQRGNAYVGGYMRSNSLTIGLTTLTKVISPLTGTGDGIVAKWGRANCDCVLPVASYSATQSGKAVQFSYTGTSMGIDSLVWNWGDGQQQKVASGFTATIVHNYTTSATYKVCVTVYNSTCGNDTYCGQTALGVSGLHGFSVIKVYPNPANTYFTIEGAEGATALLTNGIGQKAMQFSVNTNRQVMDISSLPTGMYLLQLTDAKGIRGVMSLVKE